MADLNVVDVEMKIYRLDVITMDRNASGVYNIDREHCASNLQNCSFAWRNVEYCCSVITTACVSSYVIPIYLSLISYFTDTSPCGTGRILDLMYLELLCSVLCGCIYV